MLDPDHFSAILGGKGSSRKMEPNPTIRPTTSTFPDSEDERGAEERAVLGVPVVPPGCDEGSHFSMCRERGRAGGRPYESPMSSIQVYVKLPTKGCFRSSYFPATGGAPSSVFDEAESAAKSHLSSGLGMPRAPLGPFVSTVTSQVFLMSIARPTHYATSVTVCAPSWTTTTG